VTNGWDGADPSLQNEPGVDYELATRFTANADITISGIRVWAGGASETVTGRTGRIWSTGAALLASVAMDASLPLSTWTTYNLATPLDIASGTTFDVSYDTLRYYGAISGDYPNNSSDSLVTATQGRFHATPTTFPNTTSASFYGIDIVYTENVGGNQAPEVTAISVVKTGLFVSATATVDDESPATCTLRFDWGDGNSNTLSAGDFSHDHTYDAGVIYAIMATVTDSAGLDSSYAVAVQLTMNLTTDASESWVNDIFDAVVSDVQASGYFDKVNTHEPKRKPGNGLTAAVWLQALTPIGAISGLSATSARLLFILRLYSNMLKEPQDGIDPRLTQAASNIMRRYHDDFDFGGTIRNVDLLGAHGVALEAQAGYLEQDGVMFRVMDIQIPCLVNDVWPQVS
jgi:hypothetical protein